MLRVPFGLRSAALINLVIVGTLLLSYTERYLSLLPHVYVVMFSLVMGIVIVFWSLLQNHVPSELSFSVGGSVLGILLLDENTVITTHLGYILALNWGLFSLFSGKLARKMLLANTLSIVTVATFRIITFEGVDYPYLISIVVAMWLPTLLACWKIRKDYEW